MCNMRASVGLSENLYIAVVCSQEDPVACLDGMLDCLFHILVHSRCSFALGIII